MTEVQQEKQDWTGRTVRGRDGVTLGKLTEVYPSTGEDTHGSWGVVRSRLGKRHTVPLTGAVAAGDHELQVPLDRAALRTAPAANRGEPDAESATVLQHHYTGRSVVADAHDRQHERFGGAKVGAAFFGWIVAVGMTVLLSGIATALGLAIGAGMGLDPEGPDAAAIGLTGGAVVLVVLMLAYFAGGYVAGRLARFDGARNGFLSWLVGLAATALIVAVSAVVGTQLDVFAQLRLPPVPGDPTTLTAGGVIALVAVLIGTALAAVLGGRVGERFHRRVDREALRT